MKDEYEALVTIQNQIPRQENKGKHVVRVYDEEEESVSTAESIPDLQERNEEDDSTCNSEEAEYQLYQSININDKGRKRIVDTIPVIRI